MINTNPKIELTTLSKPDHIYGIPEFATKTIMQLLEVIAPLNY